MNRIELVTFAVWCGSEGIAWDKAILLMSIARKLKRYAERACSDPSWSSADEKHQDATENRLAEIGFTIGHVVECQRDPRGHVAHIYGKDPLDRRYIPEC